MIKIVRIKEPVVAFSFSFFWVKKIYLGTAYEWLPRDVQDAVMCHEKAHVVLHHTEKRILALLTPWNVLKLCRQQEFEADRYAVDHGHSGALLYFLGKESDGGLFHPSHSERRKKIKQHEQNRLANVTRSPRQTA